MNKIKEHGFVKSQSCQPNLISFFDKGTGGPDDGEQKAHEWGGLLHFPIEKTPSKSNQSSAGRETTPEEEGSGDKEALQPPPWL